MERDGPLDDRMLLGSGGDDQPAAWCWCCRARELLLGGCTGPHPQDVRVRALDCAGHLVFWASGMYRPSGSLRRGVWNSLSGIVHSSAGRNARRGTFSFDTSIASTKVAGLRIPIRVHVPADAPETEPLPVIVYIHGGGFCIGSVRQTQFHVLADKFAAARRAVVVSVDYRLAPEHPLPAAVQDCHDVLRWLFVNPEELKRSLDLSNGIVIAGDSAGGNLSCVMSSLVRDKLDGNLEPCDVPIRIAHQVLIYPVFYLTEFEKAATEEAPFISGPIMRFFSYSYRPNDKKENNPRLRDTERRLAPFLAGPQNMPPTIIVSAGLDFLSPESFAGEKLLREAGVDVVHHHFEGSVHGFMTFHFLKEAQDAIDRICKDLDRELKPIDGKHVNHT